MSTEDQIQIRELEEEIAELQNEVSDIEGLHEDLQQEYSDLDNELEKVSKLPYIEVKELLLRIVHFQRCEDEVLKMGEALWRKL